MRLRPLGGLSLTRSFRRAGYGAPLSADVSAAGSLVVSAVVFDGSLPDPDESSPDGSVELASVGESTASSAPADSASAGAVGAGSTEASAPSAPIGSCASTGPWLTS